jgi:hypothetical protein
MFLPSNQHLIAANSLGRSVFGDGFGAFGDGVFGQFARKDQSDGGLHFAG